MTFEALLSKTENLSAENNILRDRVKFLEDNQEYLEELVRLFQLKQFASSSEKMPLSEDGDQLLFDEIEVLASKTPAESDEEQLDLIEVASHKKSKPKRKKLPKELPREKVIIELPEAERFCPHDGTALKVMGSEISERLDVIPLQMKVIETERVTYACPCCESFMKTAPPAPSIVPKGLPTAGTLAFIATNKFCDGLSLYQTENIFKRNGVEISRGSMAHWMIKAHASAQPILNLFEDEILASSYLQMDETWTQVLKEEGKKPQTKSFMWIRGTPDVKNPIVLFEYDPTRRAIVAERLMQDFKGHLQCDGYAGYDILEKNKNIILLGCMAHGRRKLRDATKVSKKANVAKHALKLVQKLYRVEDEVEGKPPNEVYKVRQEKAVPLLAALKEWVEKNVHRVPPQSPTGKALNYLRNQWIYLERYVEDGRLHIDNNFIENKIRPFAVGRKRWLFSDTVAGANASAGLYSLVETAKANNLEPYKYLRHLFEKLPLAKELCDYEALLPWNVKI